MREGGSHPRAQYKIKDRHLVFLFVLINQIQRQEILEEMRDK